MKDDDVVVVVDCALSGPSEFADDMDVRALSAGRVKPSLAEGDGSRSLVLLVLDEQDLPWSQQKSSRGKKSILPFLAGYGHLQPCNHFQQPS